MKSLLEKKAEFHERAGNQPNPKTSYRRSSCPHLPNTSQLAASSSQTHKSVWGLYPCQHTGVINNCLQRHFSHFDTT